MTVQDLPEECPSLVVRVVIRVQGVVRGLRLFRLEPLGDALGDHRALGKRKRLETYKVQELVERPKGGGGRGNCRCRVCLKRLRSLLQGPGGDPVVLTPEGQGWPAQGPGPGVVEALWPEVVRGLLWPEVGVVVCAPVVQLLLLLQVVVAQELLLLLRYQVFPVVSWHVAQRLVELDRARQGRLVDVFIVT